MGKKVTNNEGYQSLETIIQSHIDSLTTMKEDYPFFAFAIGAIMIEILGSCINPDSEIQKHGMSEKDFNYAIEHLDAFDEYRKVPFNSYASIRCSLAHSLLAGQDVVLATDEDNPKRKTIGIDEFIKSICNGWEDVKKDSIGKNRIKKKQMIIIGKSSGGTQSSLVGKLRNQYKQL